MDAAGLYRTAMKPFGSGRAGENAGWFLSDREYQVAVWYLVSVGYPVCC